MKDEKVKENKEVASLEVAESEFDRFVDIMDLDVDTKGMDDEDKQSLEQNKRRIVKAIQKGSLTISDVGEPRYVPQRTKGIEPITFREPTGASLMAMDLKKKNADIGKMYAAMSDMAGTHQNTFSKLVMSDLKVCIAVATLFLG